MTKYQKILLIVFTVVWIWAAIEPKFPHDWLLENYLVFIFVPIIIVLGCWFKLSNLSYTLITVFMILHVIGSHYTYAHVPFGFTLQEWFGADRNMYDRLLHFSFGLLMAYPIREMFLHATSARGFWGYYFPLDIVLSFSALYEIIEWGAVNLVDASSGTLFLATQGDVFDAAKDMAAALFGGVLAMGTVLALNWYFNREVFGSEMKESLRIEAAADGRRKFREIIR